MYSLYGYNNNNIGAKRTKRSAVDGPLLKVNVSEHDA